MIGTMDPTPPDDVGGVRALLFDLGGVVIELDFGRAFRRWAASASCRAAELGERFLVDEAYERHERGELDAAGYFDSLRRRLGVDLSDDELSAGWCDVYLGTVAGMSTMLAAAARRYPLFAFTNSNPTHQAVWAARFARQLSVFRSVVVSSELGLRKPDPEAFHAVAERTGFQPSELLFFDDGAENVAGARAAGMPAVLVRSSDDVRRALLGLGLELDGPPGVVA